MTATRGARRDAQDRAGTAALVVGVLAVAAGFFWWLVVPWVVLGAGALVLAVRAVKTGTAQRGAAVAGAMLGVLALVLPIVALVGWG